MNNSINMAESEGPVLTRRRKTKEELAELRKQMMKKTFKIGANSSTAELQSEISMVNPLNHVEQTIFKEETKLQLESPPATTPRATPKSKTSLTKASKSGLLPGAGSQRKIVQPAKGKAPKAPPISDE